MTIDRLVFARGTNPSRPIQPEHPHERIERDAKIVELIRWPERDVLMS